MHETAVFRIRVRGELGDSWTDYFGARSISVDVDEIGLRTTTLTSELLDQAGLVGMINCLNGMGLPVLSVECLTAPAEDERSEQDDA